MMNYMHAYLHLIFFFLQRDALGPLAKGIVGLGSIPHFWFSRSILGVRWGDYFFYDDSYWDTRLF